MRRLDDQRQAQFRGDLGQVGAVIEHRVLRRRQLMHQPDHLGVNLVHAHRASHHAAARVGNAQLFQRALQAAVFAEAAVQRDEDAVEFFSGQFGQAAFARVERMRVHAAACQRGQHARAGHQRHFALGRAAAEQDADLAQLFYIDS
ncbi:hypothetical protein D3C72_1721410 [compost metagenome]